MWFNCNHLVAWALTCNHMIIEKHYISIPELVRIVTCEEILPVKLWDSSITWCTNNALSPTPQILPGLWRQWFKEPQLLSHVTHCDQNAKWRKIKGSFRSFKTCYPQPITKYLEMFSNFSIVSLHHKRNDTWLLLLETETT